MIKSIKEINTEIMRLGIMKQGDKIPIVLKEWAESIVDEILQRDYLIYCDENEALYDYEEFESFKSEIK